jgi:hypothetical protein
LLGLACCTFASGAAAAAEADVDGANRMPEVARGANWSILGLEKKRRIFFKVTVSNSLQVVHKHVHHDAGLTLDAGKPTYQLWLGRYSDGCCQNMHVSAYSMRSAFVTTQPWRRCLTISHLQVCSSFVVYSSHPSIHG